jgi:Tol biopolymer transport system component
MSATAPTALELGSRRLEQIRGTPSPPEVPTAVWSPDGRMIAFSNWRDGRAEVYVMNANRRGNGA